MLRELLRSFLVRALPAARSLGLVYEHAAIMARHKRVRTAWEPHLAASREVILEGAALCRSKHRALVIGAGDCLDVPVEELARQFEEVTLSDVVISPVARRLERRHRRKVRCALWDATGALAGLASAQTSISSAEAKRCLEHADPGPPPGGEPDLVVSANCLSQLGLVPGHGLTAAKKDDLLPDRCAAAAAGVHLTWMARRNGVRVLIADLARIDLDRNGREKKRQDLRKTYGALRAPDRRWTWNLAPVGEWSDQGARVHEVGAWIDRPIDQADPTAV